MTRGDGRSSAAGYNPMSKWEHGDSLDDPWNGVGEVAAEVTGGKHSVRSSQSENCKSEKDSGCATKGS